MKETRTLGYLVANPNSTVSPLATTRTPFTGKGQAVASRLLGFIYSSAQIKKRLKVFYTVTTAKPRLTTTHLWQYRADHGAHAHHAGKQCNNPA